ncbi:hypothetical protein TNCV_4785981 [Trichonephila clavipes]|nr:hypothetical protein TNCV_4785981 [Trichonephila clavipes]
MAPKLDPQDEILKLLKDVCSNPVTNKAFKNQKRHFANELLFKLRKEIKFGWQSKAPGKKLGRKEVLRKKAEKKKLKRHRYCKFSASKNFSKETIGVAIDNLSSDKENRPYKVNKAVYLQMPVKTIEKQKKTFLAYVFNVTQR